MDKGKKENAMTPEKQSHRNLKYGEQFCTRFCRGGYQPPARYNSTKWN